MTIRSSTLIHFEVADLGHRHVKNTFSTLDIGDNSIHFSGSTALVDAMIAELVALRNEMEPYAPITDSERTCDQQNPDGSGEHCHRGGPHDEHRDSNGDTWGACEKCHYALDAPSHDEMCARRAAYLAAAAPEQRETAGATLCEYCDCEPATEGKYCGECVPAVALATGASL